MEFKIQCTNKGCGRIQSPVVDKITNQVHCSDCDGLLPHISIFIKNQLIQNKKFKQNIKEKKSYAFKCSSCEVYDRPTLNNDKFYCKHCKNELSNISNAFKPLLKEFLKNNTDE